MQFKMSIIVHWHQFGTTTNVYGFKFRDETIAREEYTDEISYGKNSCLKL
jgi:hypothetical protein